MMMQMYFYWGTDVTILFKSWAPSNTTEYAWSCIAVAIMAMTYELLVVIISRVDQSFSQRRVSAEEERLLQGADMGHPTRRPYKWLVYTKKQQLIRALLHTLRFFWAYLIMLAFMTYNGGLVLAICLGTFVGFLLFRGGGEDNSKAFFCH